MKLDWYVVCFGAVILALLFLVACDTIRHDPMPKWDAYELRSE